MWRGVILGRRGTDRVLVVVSHLYIYVALVNEKSGREGWAEIM
jgi:hypothetical protein